VKWFSLWLGTLENTDWYRTMKCINVIFAHFANFNLNYHMAQNFDREKYWWIWQMFSNSSIFCPSKFSILLLLMIFLQITTQGSSIHIVTLICIATTTSTNWANSKWVFIMHMKADQCMWLQCNLKCFNLFFDHDVRSITYHCTASNNRVPWAQEGVAMQD